MKNIFKNKSILLLSALAVIGSCKKDFENINNDPNNPKDVPNSFYLAGAERGIMDNTCDYWWGGQVGNQLAEYWSSNQYTSESRYNFRTQITNNYWGYFYTGGLNDETIIVGGLYELQKIINNCKSDPNKSSPYGLPANQIAVATILKVWLFQNMTDTWGDIPYSEALNPDLTRAPKYDRQSAIYSGLLSELNSALSSIDPSGTGPVGDLVYDGNVDKWAKFGNAIKMRLAIRLADRDNATASAAFGEAVSAGTFTSNDDNALMPYGESATSSNPIYNNYAVQGRNDYAASNIIIAVMDTGAGHPIEDPRLPCYFANPSSDTTNSLWVGEVYGLSEGNAAATPNSSVSQRSDLILSAALPGIYMDYAQVEFMLAEASARGWSVTGTPEDHYKAGITASIEFWTSLNGSPASQADIDAFIAQDSVDYNKQLTVAPLWLGSDTWKYPIGKQKWLALYNQGVQGWTEWRRLDFDILQLPADGIIDGTGIPLRMKYPVDEQTLNSANYNAAINSQGPDLQNIRVWWDIH
jgi:hypothetical protein